MVYWYPNEVIAREKWFKEDPQPRRSRTSAEKLELSKKSLKLIKEREKVNIGKRKKGR